MKVLGFITEYNPFHNGHKYHLQASKTITGATHTVAIMSGNFLQRGEPALTNKWIRAEMAVREGIDLVLELPVVYACNSAEYFAYGGISLLHKLGIVDFFCFGSENGNLNILQEIANILLIEPKEYKSLLRSHLSKGLSFPKARELAICQYLNLNTSETPLVSPNNILGIEYLKALSQFDSTIKPFTIKRLQAEYHSESLEGTICSATAIRKHLSLCNHSIANLQDFIPRASFAMLTQSLHKNLAPVYLSSFDAIVLYHLRSLSLNDIKDIPDVKEGLENKIKEAAIYSKNLSELLQKVKSKRYTLTRLQRIIIHSLLNIYKKDMPSIRYDQGPSYARILGFSQKGTELIRSMKTKASIPVITNINKTEIKDNSILKMLHYDICATNIYSLGYPSTEHHYGGWDNYMKPFFYR